MRIMLRMSIYVNGHMDKSFVYNMNKESFISWWEAVREDDRCFVFLGMDEQFLFLSHSFLSLTQDASCMLYM
jgi:hypothetical protein